MGVGTDTTMPPKYTFFKSYGGFQPLSEFQIDGTLLLEKILKKDPGTNAKELNRFPTQKYVYRNKKINLFEYHLIYFSGPSS